MAFFFVFIYSIANTLNNKKTAKAADSIVDYSMPNRKPGKRSTEPSRDTSEDTTV